MLSYEYMNNINEQEQEYIDIRRITKIIIK